MTDPQTAWNTGEVDAGVRDRLAAHALDYRTVDAEAPDFDGWLHGVVRGFQDGESSAEQIAGARVRNAGRRLTGVFDAAGAEPGVAVGTIASWVGELTLPGATVPACAISSVTVGQTHRRRGIARALIEGELAAAATAGLPVAMLTVTESTIYGRYGFGSAADAATIDLDTRRVQWEGPTPRGRLDYVSRERARDLVGELHDIARRRAPGDVSLPPGHEDRFTRTDQDAEKAGDVRCVQFSHPDGRITGILTYTITVGAHDRVAGTATVVGLVTVDDAAYAALWRFLTELDLVAHVHVELCTVDEPVLWMIGDRRAATVSVRDHQYLRILDVPALLLARSYSAAGSLVVEVSDPLGFAQGTVLLTVDGDGAASVGAAADAPADAVSMSVGIGELSALLIGGVSPVALARAGRLRSTDPASCARMLRWHETPRLGIWY